MIVNEFLTRLRKRIFDTEKIGYTDVELIDYLNSAIAHMGKDILNSADPSSLVTSGYLKINDPVPERFASWAGQYHITISSGKLYPADGAVFARWYVYPKGVESMNDKLPFDEQHHQRLLSLASIYALNRNEYDVSQDIALGEGVNMLPKAGK